MRASVVVATVAVAACTSREPPPVSHPRPTTLRPGSPDYVDTSDPRTREIAHYTPAELPISVANIEGAVIDANRHARVAGVVVTATKTTDQLAHQTVTDDDGRYHFDHLAPGSYSVSAYYAISGRGQFEVRRAAVVDGGQAAVVPLIIEIANVDQLNQ